MVEQLGTDLGRMLGPADSTSGSGPVVAVSARYPAPGTTSAETTGRSRSSSASDTNSDFRRILDDRMRQDPSRASEEPGGDGPHDDGVVRGHDGSTRNERRPKTAKDAETAGQADVADTQAADRVSASRAKIQSAKSTLARSTNADTVGASSASDGVGAGSASAALGPAETAKTSISVLKNTAAQTNSAGPGASKGGRNSVSNAGGAAQVGTKTSGRTTGDAKSDADTRRIAAGGEQDPHAIRADRTVTRAGSEATSTSGRTPRGQTAESEAKAPSDSQTEASRATSAGTSNQAGRLPTTDRPTGAGESPGGRAVHGTDHGSAGFGIRRGRSVAQDHKRGPSAGSDHGAAGDRASKRSTVMAESIGQLDGRRRDGSGAAGSIDTGNGGPDRTEASAAEAGSVSAADRITVAADPAARPGDDGAGEPAATFGVGRSTGRVEPGAVHRQIVDRLVGTPPAPGRQIQITLAPPELGRVRVQFAEIDGQIHGQLEVQNAQTRQLMERHVTEIVAALQNQGIQVQRIEVMPEPSAPQDPPQPGRDQADQGFLPFNEAPPDGGHSASGDGRRSSSQTPSDPTWNETAAEHAQQRQQYTEDRVNLYA